MLARGILLHASTVRCWRRRPAPCAFAFACNQRCHPPRLPPAHACSNRDKFLLSEEEQGLISGPCLGTVSCRQEVGWDYQGGDIPTGDGINNVTAPAKTVKDCCIACQGMASCGAYTYAPSIQMCYFKVGGWGERWLRGMYLAPELFPQLRGNDMMCMQLR